MDVFTLMAKLSLDKSEYDSGIKEASSSGEGLASKLSSGMANAGKALAPVSGAAAALGGALVATGVKTAAYADNVDKMSQKLGISRQAYQEWDYVMSQNGTSIDSMQAGMKNLIKAMDGVKSSGDTAGTVFEKLGWTYEDLNNKSPEQVFSDTIIALQNCKDETEKTALATQLFGKSGMELAPLLNQSAASTELLKRKAEDLGLVMSDDALDAGVEMTDAMDTMKRSLATVGMSIAKDVMPMITKFADFVTKNLPKVKEAVAKVQEKFNALPEPIKNAVPVIIALVAALSPVLLIGSQVVSMISSFASGLLALNPIVLVIIGVCLLLIANWETVKATAEAVWNFIVEKFNFVKDSIATAVENIKNAVTTAWENIRSAVENAMSNIYSKVQSAWTNIKTKVSSTVGNIKSDIENKFNAVKTTLDNTWEKIKTSVSNAFETAKNTVSSAIDTIKSYVNFEWHLPHLNLPHIHITGEWGFNPPRVPSFSVEWYKKAMDGAMILDSPTIFGMANGNLLGGGEAGREVVSGEAHLIDLIRQAVAEVQTSGNVYQTINVNQAIATPDELARKIRRESRFMLMTGG